MDEREVSFEEAFRLLEQTVQRLEDGGLTIDEMVHHFELGMALVAACREKLAAAEARVRVLARPVAEAMDEGLDEFGDDAVDEER